MLPKLYPVILCGGAGTRLWPLSRQEYPKQFAVELEGMSLLDLTLARAKGLGEVARCLAVTGEAYRFMVLEALGRAELDGSILLEPVARNTAPAIAAAALKVVADDPDGILVILPSDHYVPDAPGFARAIGAAAQLAVDDWWVTLGIRPLRASTAYGYLRPGAELDASARVVARFEEKPDAARAEQLVADGCLWNAGIFVVRAEQVLTSIRTHAPEVLEAVSRASAGMTPDAAFLRLDDDLFATSPSISIDYAVLEKEERVAMLPYEGAWTDLGSWDALAGVHAADQTGNRSEGEARFVEASNSFVYSPKRLTVALGVDDLVIVDTADALLVASRDRAEDVKSVVEALKAQDRPEIIEHRQVARPWGHYEAIDRGEGYQVKRITVKPGAALSLQYHHHRAEHWVVVKGVARVTCDEHVFELEANQSTYIPVGSTHRLENPGSEPLELIEVQSGDYLGEDDIVRLDDTYGRLPAQVKARP